MSDYQTLTYGGPGGPQTIEAPAGWVFNDTDIRVWVLLVARMREHQNYKGTIREARYLEGKLDVLAQVLSNTLGMAPHYWYGAALEHVKSDKTHWLTT